jgi:hypothetical protein
MNIFPVPDLKAWYEPYTDYRSFSGSHAYNTAPLGYIIKNINNFSDGVICFAIRLTCLKISMVPRFFSASLTTIIKKDEYVISIHHSSQQHPTIRHKPKIPPIQKKPGANNDLLSVCAKPGTPPAKRTVGDNKMLAKAHQP